MLCNEIIHFQNLSQGSCPKIKKEKKKKKRKEKKKQKSNIPSFHCTWNTFPRERDTIRLSQTLQKGANIKNTIMF